MSKTGLFLGGVPTEPDVKKLIAAFPSIAVGDVLEHERIAKILGVERGSNRYLSVTSAWRRHMLRAGNLRIVASPGIGFQVVDGMERVTDNVKRYGRGTKQIRRAAEDIRRVELEKLDQNQQRVTEHVIRHMEASIDHLRKASKEIAIEFKPQDQLPRVRLAK